MIQKMNRASAADGSIDPELEARIESLRTRVPHADARRRKHSTSRKESEATKKLYGLDEPETAGLRMAVSDGPAAGRAQRAVHPDQSRVWPGNEVGWDAHSELVRLHTRTRCK